ncbi:hypothetical protein ACHQM5_007041 [Ranunculus cassubicifolius]
MENHQILQLKKLGVNEILKEAIKIPFKSPKFIFLAFLTSLPLIFIMVLHEFILLTSIVETKSLLTPPPPSSDYFENIYYYRRSYMLYDSELETIIMLFRNMSPRILQLAFLYLVPLHLLDLLNTIITIHSTCTLYSERPIQVKEMLLIPIRKTRFTGPLVTSLYVLFLNTFILFGLAWLVTNTYLSPFGIVFMIIYGVGSIILTLKWMEWSAVWNMSTVFSVLEERHGFAALGASGYISRGNRGRGLQLMLLFYVWRILLRLSCHYVGGHDSWVGLVTASFLSCVGNVMKWVVCTVYFYDCKKRTFEKKVDVEQGDVGKDAKAEPT